MVVASYHIPCLLDTTKTGWWCNNHLEKYEFVNGKDDIPYMKWNIKHVPKPPTRDITKNWFSTIAERVDYHDTISGLFHSPKSSHADLRRQGTAGSMAGLGIYSNPTKHGKTEKPEMREATKYLYIYISNIVL